MRPAAVAVVGIATGTALAAAAVVGVRRRWLVVTVVGTSMLPAYRPGDRVLVVRRAGMPAVGDVVVLDPPDGSDRPPSRRPDPAVTWMLKRVSGLPGDPLPDPPGGVVPPGAVAVLGDNGGHDSRAFGALPRGRVVGVVVRSLPPDRSGGPDGR